MGIFDQEKKKKLILVHSSTTVAFANYLQMLISSKDDKEDKIVGVEDGTVETVIWSEKEYAAQKPTLSSADHILFIGRGKTLSEEAYGMKEKYNNFGIEYGWLGRHAYVRVAGGWLKKEQLKDFMELAKKYDPEFDVDNAINNETRNMLSEAKDFFESLQKNIQNASDQFWDNLPLMNEKDKNKFRSVFQKNIQEASNHLWDNMPLINDKEKNNIRSCQYRTAINIFYMEGLADFLNT